MYDKACRGQQNATVVAKGLATREATVEPIRWSTGSVAGGGHTYSTKQTNVHTKPDPKMQIFFSETSWARITGQSRLRRLTRNAFARRIYGIAGTLELA